MVDLLDIFELMRYRVVVSKWLRKFVLTVKNHIIVLKQSLHALTPAILLQKIQQTI